MRTRHTGPSYLPWAALALLLATSACAPTARVVPAPRPAAPAPSARPTAPPAAGPDYDVAARLRDEVEAWRGTPHVLGGEDRHGLDCSAFVRTLYDDLFDLSLPRTTAEQVEVGAPVPADALRAGDLVFFRPSKNRHVGIYLSDGEFAHVSSSQGVTVSRLADRYWQETYWTARRLLPDAPPPTGVAGPAAGAERLPERDAVQEPPRPPRARRSRIGW